MLTKYLCTQGTVTDWEAGDLDGDGNLSAADLSLLKQIILKK
jgi:hypothetical protein